MAENDPRQDERLKGLVEDYLGRLRRGERPSIEEYAQRHPDLAGPIGEIFPTLGLVEMFKPDTGEVTEDRPSAVLVTGSGAPLDRLGDFRILREVGRGGMGVVYEAEQESLGRHVALKVLSGNRLADPKIIARFEREARAAAGLHHTNIVPVFEVGQEGGVYYYAMQHIQGQGLDLVIQELRRLRDHSQPDPEPGPGPGAQPGAGGRPGRAPVPAPEDAAEGARRISSLRAEQAGRVARSLVSGRFATSDSRGPRRDPPSLGSPSLATAATAVLGEPIESDTTDAGAADAAGAEPVAGTRDSPSPSSSAVLPGGAQLSTVESGRRPYYLSVARIGQQAAQALGYAHARGIVHRDIKPANLLLDTAGVVWLTDFGLAKGEADGLTDPGAVVGTLRYMAPERFRGQADPRSDIYALGLTLYELLTLEPAFNSRDRMEVIDQIRNAEPQPPRARDPRIPRDLETIVLKAIEKEPGARYSTAVDLAEDLRRFSDDQPILARKSTFPERVRRWHRRNRAVAGLVWFLLVVLTSGLTVVTWLYRREDRERQRAEANFRDARAAVDDYLTRVSQERLLDVPGLQPLRKDLYEMALRYYQNFILQHERDPRLRAELANAYERVGMITELIGARPDALAAHQKALEIRAALASDYPANPGFLQDVAESEDSIGELLRIMGRHGDAEQSYRRAITILERMVVDHPGVRSFHRDLARSYNSLGLLQKTIGQMSQAEHSYRRAIDHLEPWNRRDNPGSTDGRQALAQSYTNLGSLKGTIGEMAEAGQWIAKAIPIFEGLAEANPQSTRLWQDLGKTHRNLGMLQSLAGQGPGAERSYRQAVEIQERLNREHPSVVEFQQDLAETCTELGAFLSPTRKEEAARSYQRAIDIQEALARAHPGVVGFQQYLARSYSVLGMLQAESAPVAAARQSLERALPIQEGLVRDHPDVPEHRRDLSITHNGLGKLHRALDQPAEALQAWQEAVRLIESLPNQSHVDFYNMACAYALASTVVDQVPARARRGEGLTPEKLVDKALEALRRAVAAGWNNPDQMETDGDLEALRLRKEFREVIESIPEKG